MSGLTNVEQSVGTSQQPTNAMFDEFITALKRRKILWDLLTGIVVTNTVQVGRASIAVILDGDNNPLPVKTLIGPVPAQTKVAIIFVPPAGYYIIGIVGGSPPTALGLVAGVNILSTGSLTTAASAETDIPQLSFKATLSSLRSYEIRVQVFLQGTVVDDQYNIIVRRDTALVGTTLGQLSGGGATVQGPHFNFPYTPSSTGLYTLFFSHARRSGTGTWAAFGTPGASIARTWAAVYDVGPAGLMTVV